MPTRQGSILLFRFAGIDVYIHWAWFLAFFYFPSRPNNFSNYGWSALEILGLFLIVLTHEFGHALACRSVGGQANLIVLWPLGGVAYVAPPQRPGAQLWSIAAGPLVNVVLVPILIGIVMLARQLEWDENHPDAFLLLMNIRNINIVILIFNMLPVYPLDGGQILRSLLWYPLGRANSLMVASIIGFIGVAGLIGLAFWMQSVWMGIMAAFILMNCWGGLMQARALATAEKTARRAIFTCPGCHASPPTGALWRCRRCKNPFDIFATQGLCPHCNAQYNLAQCLDCGALNSLNDWQPNPEDRVRTAE